jgi:hypothetical protein
MTRAQSAVVGLREHAGGVHQDLDPAGLLVDRRHGGLDPVLVRDVEHDGPDAQPLGEVRQAVGVEVRGDDPRSGGDEGLDDREPDAARATRHQGGRPGEVEHRPVAHQSAIRMVRPPSTTSSCPVT